jgi:hypothetical protein
MPRSVRVVSSCQSVLVEEVPISVSFATMLVDILPADYVFPVLFVVFVRIRSAAPRRESGLRITLALVSERRKEGEERVPFPCVVLSKIRDDL